jgi:hypothetical protein
LFLFPPHSQGGGGGYSSQTCPKLHRLAAAHRPALHKWLNPPPPPQAAWSVCIALRLEWESDGPQRRTKEDISCWPRVKEKKNPTDERVLPKFIHHDDGYHVLPLPQYSKMACVACSAQLFIYPFRQARNDENRHKIKKTPPTRNMLAPPLSNFDLKHRFILERNQPRVPVRWNACMAGPHPLIPFPFVVDSHNYHVIPQPSPPAL